MWRRLLYAGAAPLIPLVRLSRILPVVQRVRRHEHVPGGVRAAVVLGLAIDAVGQFVGYLLGAGGAKQRLSTLEYHRDQHVRKPQPPVANDPALR